MKKIKAKIKLQIPAGQATPAPPVGPALAPHGLNIKEFCEKFNQLTKNQLGFTIPVEITVFEDKSYEMKLKQPPVSELLKKAAGIEKGSGEPKKKLLGRLQEINSEKLPKEN